MPQRIFILGATGFIGRNLTMHFASEPKFEVHATFHIKKPYDVDNVRWHYCDLRNHAQVSKLFREDDIVIQAAATTSGSKDIITQPFIHVTDNAIMNSLILRECFEKSVAHFIFFSCSVMYQSSTNPLAEEDFNPSKELVPNYFGVGHTKLYIERMCEFFARISDTKFTVIRHSNIYGPFDKFDLERSHFLGATISKVLTAKKEIVVWGDGEEKRDVLYIDDLITFVAKAITSQEKQYSLLNCGAGQARSVLEIIKNIIVSAGRDIEIEFDLTKPSIKTALCLDTSKAKAELGWEPSFSLEAGLLETVGWWQDNIDPQTLSLK